MTKIEELKTAADLAKEQDPELFTYIYCYKDKAVDRYAPIFQNDKEPKFMVDGLKASVQKGQNLKELTGLQLCFCGTFELKEGKFQLFEKPELLIDCDVLIEKIGGPTNGQVC